MYKILLIIALCSLLGCDSIKENQLDGRTYYAVLQYGNYERSANDPIRVDSTMSEINRFKFQDGQLHHTLFTRMGSTPYHIKNGNLILETPDRDLTFILSNEIDDLITIATSPTDMEPRLWILVSEDAWHTASKTIRGWRLIMEENYEKD